MKKTWIIIIAIVAAGGLGAGVYFGAKAIYDAGVADGRNKLSQEISEDVKKLGSAVSEKTTLQQTINSTLAEVPAEINAEGIDNYIAKLTDLINTVTIEDAKSTLEDYQNKWVEFKSTYASEDNNAISESFNALKAAATDTAAKLKTSYDNAVREALNNL